MPKVKPVRAWAVLTDKNTMHMHSNWKKSLVQQYAATFIEQTEVVRVEIRVVPPKRRKGRK